MNPLLCCFIYTLYLYHIRLISLFPCNNLPAVKVINSFTDRDAIFISCYRSPLSCAFIWSQYESRTSWAERILNRLGTRGPWVEGPFQVRHTGGGSIFWFGRRPTEWLDESEPCLKIAQAHTGLMNGRNTVASSVRSGMFYSIFIFSIGRKGRTLMLDLSIRYCLIIMLYF